MSDKDKGYGLFSIKFDISLICLYHYIAKKCLLTDKWVLLNRGYLLEKI